MPSAYPKNPARFMTRRLLIWYRAFGRDLPWRQTHDPYQIWVSEVMLQQTQVKTVLPFYHKFLLAFPTLHDLAEAPIGSVLKLWEGLGYYARARNLHQAAKEVAARFCGTFPSKMDDVLSLPGIGRSTAGAILTIAFGQRHPILDGNVRRVLCRYFCIQEDPRKATDELWHCSASLLPERNAGDFLQAIMDFGATVCTQTDPQCLLCPVRKGCKGYQNGLQEALPLKGIRNRIPHRDYVAGIIFKGERVLIRRRPMKGLLGGLWEFPGGEARSDPPDAFKKVLSVLFCEKNSDPLQPISCMTIRHAFTHFRMTLHVFLCRVRTPVKNGSGEMRWVLPEELEEYPFPSAYQKIVCAVTEKGNSIEFLNRFLKRSEYVGRRIGL